VTWLFVKAVTNASNGKLFFATYNYDRSLEFFLFRAINNIYPDKNVALKIYEDKIRIVHLHGDIGMPEFWSGMSGKGRQYTKIENTMLLTKVAQNISLPDEAISEKAYETYMSYKAQSDSIVLLGFGFALSRALSLCSM
jgi:hypothetical protein